jgi:hypothetical protein
MSVTITYTDDDFKNAAQINIEDLQNIINASAITSAAVLYINYTTNNDNTFSAGIVFDGSVSPGDITLLDNIITAYTYNSYSETYATIKDVKPAGSNGGLFTANAWQTRILNTIEGDMKFASLSNNVITLQPGNYSIFIKAPACDVRNHQSRLWNIVDSTAIMGSNAYSYNGIMTSSDIFTVLSVSAEKTFRIEHICSDTSANIGFGKATGFASDEIYTIISIQII